MPLISIIIRAKNEERWIGRCLKMISQQTLRDYEIILVDNLSSDHTVGIAKKYPVQILTIDKFTPGKAINMGIRTSSGSFLVMLSAHCIPRDEKWLEALLRNMDNKNVAGVYGRQLPFAYSSDLDKRDLLITFGLDHRVQIKDSFFHNANSMVRRSVWENIPFDEDATNIEDRIWGKKVIESGYQIAYEPEGAVFHHHGIHQNRNTERARHIVQIMESLNGLNGYDALPEGFKPQSMNTLAILPILGDIVKIGGIDLLQRSFAQIKEAQYIKKIAVISENPEALSFARRNGAMTIERPGRLAERQVSVEEVLQYALQKAEQGEEHFDSALYVNYLYPFRPKGFFDKLITRFALTGVDSLIPTLQDYQPHWREAEGKVIRCDDGFMPREFKVPVQKGMLGLGSLTSGEYIRKGSLLGDNIALLTFKEPLYALKASDGFSKSVIAYALELDQGQQSFENPHASQSV